MRIEANLENKAGPPRIVRDKHQHSTHMYTETSQRWEFGDKIRLLMTREIRPLVCAEG